MTLHVRTDEGEVLQVPESYFTRTGQDAVLSATGATGARGPAGTNGTNGTNGARGTDGTNGTNGTNGTTPSAGTIMAALIATLVTTDPLRKGELWYDTGDSVLMVSAGSGA